MIQSKKSLQILACHVFLIEKVGLKGSRVEMKKSHLAAVNSAQPATSQESCGCLFLGGLIKQRLCHKETCSGSISTDKLRAWCLSQA